MKEQQQSGLGNRMADFGFEVIKSESSQDKKKTKTVKVPSKGKNS